MITSFVENLFQSFFYYFALTILYLFDQYKSQGMSFSMPLSHNFSTLSVVKIIILGQFFIKCSTVWIGNKSLSKKFNCIYLAKKKYAQSQIGLKFEKIFCSSPLSLKCGVPIEQIIYFITYLHILCFFSSLFRYWRVYQNNCVWCSGFENILSFMHFLSFYI